MARLKEAAAIAHLSLSDYVKSRCGIGVKVTPGKGSSPVREAIPLRDLPATPVPKKPTFTNAIAGEAPRRGVRGR